MIGKNEKKQNSATTAAVVGAAIGAGAIIGAQKALKSPKIRAAVNKMKADVTKKISMHEKDAKKEISKVKVKLEKDLPKIDKK
jgi:hypothetical protein